MPNPTAEQVAEAICSKVAQRGDFSRHIREADKALAQVVERTEKLLTYIPEGEITDLKWLRQDKVDQLGHEAENLYSSARAFFNVLLNLNRRKADFLPPPDLAEMTADIEQLMREFPEFHFDEANTLIGVTTDDIKLQFNEQSPVINLGKFKIMVRYTPGGAAIAERRYHYTIQALTPNYPAREVAGGGYGTHPHPHMRENKLCEGEGVVAITRLLNEFQLCDFFLIIKSILNNYNPHSPYSKLEDWLKVQCHYCGENYVSTEMVKCHYCEALLCTQCASQRTCSVCEEVICHNHSGQRSIKKCPTCHKTFCGKHFESVRKHSCHKEMMERQEKSATLILECWSGIKSSMERSARPQEAAPEEASAQPGPRVQEAPRVPAEQINEAEEEQRERPRRGFAGNQQTGWARR